MCNFCKNIFFLILIFSLNKKLWGADAPEYITPKISATSDETPYQLHELEERIRTELSEHHWKEARRYLISITRLYAKINQEPIKEDTLTEKEICLKLFSYHPTLYLEREFHSLFELLAGLRHVEDSEEVIFNGITFTIKELLTTCKTLWIDARQFVQILPINIGRYSNLERLTLSCFNFEQKNAKGCPHQLISLNSVLEKLSHLRYFKLPGSKLDVLPLALTHCSHLSTLDLSGIPLDNAIVFSSLYTILTKLNNLESINLSNCKISQLPTTLFSCKKLKELNISSNPIVESEDLTTLHQNMYKQFPCLTTFITSERFGMEAKDLNNSFEILETLQ